MKTINGKTYLSIEDYKNLHPPIPQGTFVKTKCFGHVYIVGCSCVLKENQFVSWKYCVKMYNTDVGPLNPLLEVNQSDIYE